MSFSVSGLRVDGNGVFLDLRHTYLKSPGVPQQFLGTTGEVATASPLAAPTSLVVTPGSNKLSVAFTGSTGADSYMGKVYPSGSPNSVLASGVVALSSPAVFTGLVSGTAYQVQVAAVAVDQTPQCQAIGPWSAVGAGISA